MSRSGRVARRCGRTERISPRDVLAFLLSHRWHRGEKGVFPLGGKAARDATGDAEVGLCIG